MSVISRLLRISRKKSPWIYCTNAGACNGCDIEISACLVPRYDMEQRGMLRVGSPKHADILLVTGPVTVRTRQGVCDIYNQMPGPKAVVAVGSCPASADVFAGSPTVEAPLEKFIPVDVYVPGCPPRPQAIIKGIAMAAERLAEGKTRDREAGALTNKEAVG